MWSGDIHISRVYEVGKTSLTPSLAFTNLISHHTNEQTILSSG